MAQEADQVLVEEEPVCLAHWVSCDKKLDKKKWCIYIPEMPHVRTKNNNKENYLAITK